MQQEIDRQVSVLRNLDEPFEQLYSAAARQTYFSNHQDGHNGPPISPRQFAQDDHRRQALGQPRHALPHFNKAMPSHLSIQPRRYGSIGAQGGLSGTATPSPSSLRYQVGAPPPLPQQVSNLAIPAGANLARRHTSADIRVQTWPPNSAAYNDQAATPPVPSWQFSDRPSTPPVRAPFADPENQRIRESFSSYSFGSASMPKHSEQQSQIRASSRPSTPPFAPSNGGGLWNWGQQGNDKFGGNGNSSSSSAFGAGQHGAHSLFKENALNSGPPTRRGSMAHILNPAETAERNEDDEGRDDEDRKRKRLG